jgi:hypothetical protein
VLIERLGHQHDADEQEEAQRQHLHGRVAADEVGDRVDEDQHHDHGDHGRDDHDDDVLRHADRGDDRVEREHHVEQEDLRDDEAERGALAAAGGVILVALELRVDLVGSLGDEEEAAQAEHQVAPGYLLSEHGEERRGEPHDPGDREQEREAQDERQPDAEPAGARLLVDRKPIGKDRDEHDVVDAEHDLHQGQGEEGDPGVAGLKDRQVPHAPGSYHAGSRTSGTRCTCSTAAHHPGRTTASAQPPCLARWGCSF